MKLEVLNKDGKKTGKQVDLPDDIFNIEPHEHAVYLAVKQYNANQRQGTHAAKEKGQITGSTRKIKRQKGTGTARAGSIKSGLFRGGGRIFGPRPDRNYSLKLNKKVKRLARMSALSSKMSAGQIIVVEDFTFETPDTKGFVNFISNLELSGKRALLVTGEYDQSLYLSSRNLQKAGVARAQDLNTYEVLKANTLILSEGSIAKIKETFA
ncbi:MAG: large subunit ribosomal protein L4 [Saprospiraceae bacterium]|jgi:large subunit ribosomal protein L4